MSDKSQSAESAENIPVAEKVSDTTNMQEQEQNQRIHIQGILPDTSIPPPPLPPAYKTLLYPAYTDKLNSARPAEKQMKSISLNWKSGEELCSWVQRGLIIWISASQTSILTDTVKLVQNTLQEVI